MIRTILAVSAIALGVAPAMASNYSAKPVAPTSERFAARDITWTCTSGACRGSTAESRPVVLCQALAKRVGRIETFAVDGRDFAPAELEKCNSAAKAAPGAALAAH